MVVALALRATPERDRFLFRRGESSLGRGSVGVTGCAPEAFEVAMVKAGGRGRYV
jgi:hypothetical protein